MGKEKKQKKKKAWKDGLYDRREALDFKMLVTHLALVPNSGCGIKKMWAMWTPELVVGERSKSSLYEDSFILTSFSSTLNS